MADRFEQENILENLLTHNPVLDECKESIKKAYFLLEEMYSNGGCLYIAGNGGSASDSGHISGELMKSFRLKRQSEPQTLECYEHMFGSAGMQLGKKLEKGLPAVPLPELSTLITAVSNDMGGDYLFSQSLNALSKAGDAFWGISTSGNSINIINAMMVASVKGMFCIGLTGKNECKMDLLCDVVIHVPATETYRIQELHQPVYHALCAMLESHFFG